MLLQMLRVSCITFFPPKINSLHRYSALVAPLHSCIGITCTKIPPFSFEQNHFLHRMFQEELTIDDAPNPLEHFPMQEFDAMVVRFLKLMPCFPLPPDLWDIVGEYLDTAKTLDVMAGECVYINLFQRSNRIQNRILIVLVVHYWTGKEIRSFPLHTLSTNKRFVLVMQIGMIVFPLP